MAILKRPQWTEAEVFELPAGEQDFFDRKSAVDFPGYLDNFFNFTANALSAFANSGGGHLILGLKDDGAPLTGCLHLGGQRTHWLWLEQPQNLSFEA